MGKGVVVPFGERSVHGVREVVMGGVDGSTCGWRDTMRWPVRGLESQEVKDNPTGRWTP